MPPSTQDPDSPQIAFVVVAGARPLRLRWLLNALEEQTGLDAPAEVVVLDRLGGAPAARAPLVAFCDEDTRPDPDWALRALRHAARAPDAVIAGRLAPDPLEESGLLATLHHTRRTRAGDPLAPLAGTVWPRSVLERLGGPDESAPDAAAAAADLFARALEAGVAVVAAEDLVLHDSVRPGLAPGAEAGLPWAVRRHPALRRRLALGAFRRPSHAVLAAGGVAAAVAPRRVVGAALVVVGAALVAGVEPRAIVRRALRESLSMAALAGGSLRHRTLVL